jgi:hypothetical protein
LFTTILSWTKKQGKYLPDKALMKHGTGMYEDNDEDFTIEKLDEDHQKAPTGQPMDVLYAATLYEDIRQCFSHLAADDTDTHTYQNWWILVNGQNADPFPKTTNKTWIQLGQITWLHLKHTSCSMEQLKAVYEEGTLFVPLDVLDRRVRGPGAGEEVKKLRRKRMQVVTAFRKKFGNTLPTHYETRNRKRRLEGPTEARATRSNKKNAPEVAVPAQVAAVAAVEVVAQKAAEAPVPAVAAAVAVAVVAPVIAAKIAAVVHVNEADASAATAEVVKEVSNEVAVNLESILSKALHAGPLTALKQAFEQRAKAVHEAEEKAMTAQAAAVALRSNAEEAETVAKQKAQYAQGIRASMQRHIAEAVAAATAAVVQTGTQHD